MRTEALDPALSAADKLNPQRRTQLTDDEAATATALLHSVLTQPAEQTHAATRIVVHAAHRRIARRVAGIGLAGTLSLVSATAATGVTPTGLTVGVQALAASTPTPLDYSDPAGARATELLNQIADAVATAAPTPAASGAYRQVHWQSWSYLGGEGGDGLAPQDRWAWFHDDGTARTQVRSDGALGAFKDWPVGGYGVPLSDRIHLTTDPATATEALSRNASAGTSDAYRMVDRYIQGAETEGLGADEADRVGFLRALAATDVKTFGTATDTAGRTGVAFGASWSHDGLRTELRILIDPDNGAILSSEEVLHGPWILGSRDAVVYRIVFLDNTRVANLPPCGDLGCRTMPTPG